jgi:hypothetical protein
MNGFRKTALVTLAKNVSFHWTECNSLSSLEFAQSSHIPNFISYMRTKAR